MSMLSTTSLHLPVNIYIILKKPLERIEFSYRINVLGHAQQGGNPAPFDRNMGTKLAANALEFILAQAKKYVDPATGMTNATAVDSATLLGLKVLCYCLLNM